MNFDFVKARKFIYEHNKRHIESAEKYAEICEEYGKLMGKHQKLLAGRIMTYKQDKKNLGVDFAILMAIADKEWKDNTEFVTVNDRMNELEYLKKGMERVIDAYKSESMSIMGIMKYQFTGETYGE